MLNNLEFIIGIMYILKSFKLDIKYNILIILLSILLLIFSSIWKQFNVI